MRFLKPADAIECVVELAGFIDIDLAGLLCMSLSEASTGLQSLQLPSRCRSFGGYFHCGLVGFHGSIGPRHDVSDGHMS